MTEVRTVQKFKVQITITRKKDVLDPQGKAVQTVLHGLGYEEVDDVRVGKEICFTVDGDSREAVRTRVEVACKKGLVNPNIEQYVCVIEPV